jgi:uncharacterized membrane protein
VFKQSKSEHVPSEKQNDTFQLVIRVADGDVIELIAAIIVALVMLVAICYAVGSVVDFRPARSPLVVVLRASAVLAGVRISCLWWLLFGFKTLWSP